MTLRLLKNFAKKLEITPPDPLPDAKPPIHYAIRYGSATYDGADNRFAIVFNIAIDLEEGPHLELEHMSIFQIDEEVTPELLKSPMIKTNAAAIAFPFVRSFLSQVTLISGYQPIILPSINFAKQAESHPEKV